MKRILVLLLSLTLIVMMTACVGNEPVESSLDNMLSSLFEEEQNDLATETSSMKEQSNDNSNDGWKAFLKEYEEWADKYISVMKKYKANPTDLSILSEYTTLVAELADWTERADDISNEIVDISDAAEYSAEIIRIAAKIAKAAEEL